MSTDTTTSRARGPVDATVVPRYGGPSTFARLPRLDEVDRADVAVVGVPFDSGVSYRPGARFGPGHIRASSKLLRTYNPVQDVEPFAVQQVVDAGDVACNPFDILEAVRQIDEAAREIAGTGAKLMTIGGDHTIALPLLRVLHEQHGEIAVVHFDAHLDTWDTYFGAPITHGTPFRRASEEGLIDKTGSMHVGIRGPLYSREDLTDDQVLGFQVVGSHDVDDMGWRGVVERIRTRVGDRPTYVSLDIDVLDPAFAPGTGTPEVAGLGTREALGFVRALRGLRFAGYDVVEVSPPYDGPGQPTAVAAANVAFELLTLDVLGSGGGA